MEERYIPRIECMPEEALRSAKIYTFPFVDNKVVNCEYNIGLNYVVTDEELSDAQNKLELLLKSGVKTYVELIDKIRENKKLISIIEKLPVDDTIFSSRLNVFNKLSKMYVNETRYTGEQFSMKNVSNNIGLSKKEIEKLLNMITSINFPLLYESDIYKIATKLKNLIDKKNEEITHCRMKELTKHLGLLRYLEEFKFLSNDLSFLDLLWLYNFICINYPICINN